MKRMCGRILGWALIGILGFSLIASIVFLIYVAAHRCTSWEATTAELLLVIVLAAEGLFAIAHLNESRTARQAEALRDFMRDFSSAEDRRHKIQASDNLPWRQDSPDIPVEMVKWKVENQNGDIIYKMENDENRIIPVTMESKAWRLIVELSDQYHFAELSCRRGYIDKNDILEWIGHRPLRWWRRLGGIIIHERVRRENPTLFIGFENFAKSTEKFIKQNEKSA